MATKEHRKYARGLIEALESRVHVGPPVHHNEIHSAREFLLRNDFSPSSDYFSRLGQIQYRLESRTKDPCFTPAKRNYGGEAGGSRMQVQSIYDHVIVSTCYEGTFNFKNGRVKISHRFNEQGRIDFVELKFLKSLEPCLTGEIRKIISIRDYQHLRKDWHATGAFVLPVLPREIIFLHPDVFRCERTEILAWLINIGHRIVEGLIDHLRAHRTAPFQTQMAKSRDQLPLEAVREDEIGWPILERVSGLESAVEMVDLKQVVVRYIRK